MEYLEAGIKVLQLIEDNGFQAYFVGGFVRDYLLKIKENDIDITTNALPHNLKNIFEVVNTGIKYNSVKVIFAGFEFEITTFRVDLNYFDNRHPIYEVAKTLSEDLKRRDFTINAMAMDKDLKLIDIFNGKNDLENKLIRTVFDARKRFLEDSLRILRACYFAAKLDFSIEKDTLSAMKATNYLVQNLSNDRIMWELEKIINTNNYLVGFKYIEESGVINYLPLYKKGISLLLKKQIKAIDWPLFLAICFYEVPDKLRDIQLKTHLRVLVEQSIELAKKVKKNTFNNVLLFDYGLKICENANVLNMLYLNAKNNQEEILDIDKLIPIHQIGDIKIKTNEIIDLLELKDYKKIGIIMGDLRVSILNSKLINDNAEIKAYILKQYKKI